MPLDTHTRVPTIGDDDGNEKGSQRSSKGLEDLFYDGLKDIYYSERKILTALKKLAKGAESEELTAAFEKHREETEAQIERLQQVFDIFGKRAQGKTCPAIDGIIEEDRCASLGRWTRGRRAGRRAL